MSYSLEAARRATEERTRALEGAVAAANQHDVLVERAARMRREALAHAVALGVPKIDLAAALQCSRPTLDAWLRERR